MSHWRVTHVEKLLNKKMKDMDLKDHFSIDVVSSVTTDLPCISLWQNKDYAVSE